MIITLDYETHKIVNGSPTPPKPVGIAIKIGKKKGKYYAWGHPTENNCKEAEAKAIVRALNLKKYQWAFHNAKFDVSVMKYHWGMEPKAQVDDTMIMAFLANPHAKSLALKTQAARELDWPATEQDKLRDWIIENVKGATEKNFGAYIAKAPGDLTGLYAVGDVDRTFELYNHYKGMIL
jgi:DNA polymerase I-like protein with 3'-5' exonuclease and polymerase domains